MNANKTDLKKNPALTARLIESKSCGLQERYYNRSGVFLVNPFYSPMFHFYTAFLTFSGGIQTEHRVKMGMG